MLPPRKCPTRLPLRGPHAHCHTPELASYVRRKPPFSACANPSHQGDCVSFDQFYAHSLPDQPEERWERLEVHLEEVSSLAGRLAAAFGAGEWGELAGLWHDLGKYKPEFQARLRGSREQLEHAGVAVARRMAPLEGLRGDGSLLRPLDESLGSISQLLEREEAIISITELDAEHFLSENSRRDVPAARWADPYAQTSPAVAGVNPAAVVRNAFPLRGTCEAGLLDFGDLYHAAVHPRMYR